MRGKKVYEIDDILTIRLSKASGTNEEVIEYINSITSGEVGKTLIKAIKFWYRTQDNTADNTAYELRNAIENEDPVPRRYGQNKGPYKKKHTLENKAPETIEIPDTKPVIHKMSPSNVPSTTNQKNPMMNALNSIKK